jgi:transcriptional regulator GlxA family with amidase domain
LHLEATVAAEVAKRLVLYARRPGYQSRFSPVLQAQLKADSPFAELIEWMQSNLDKPLDISAMAARAMVCERSFHRKFVAATGTRHRASWKLFGLMRRASCCGEGSR